MAIEIFDIVEKPMTSKTTPSPYVVSASSEYGSTRSAHYVFNKTLATTADASWASSGVPAWVQIFVAKKYIVTEYKLSARAVTVDATTSGMPKDFQLLGSNDGVDWTVLDNRNGITGWINSETRAFTTSNKSEFSYFRLNVTQTNGHTDVILDEMALFGYEPTNKFLISSGDKSYSYRGFGVNMTNYFTFDEASGNVTDSKGTAVGTVSGATRVQGWNGEGYALRFNAVANTVVFNSMIVNPNNFTIRFKIYLSSLVRGRVLNTLTTSTPMGIALDLTENGVLNFYYYNTNTSYCHLLAPFLQTNTWNDITISVDDINKVCKLYVNEQMVDKTSKIISFTGGANFTIGGSKLGVNGFLGQIDNLEIYNDVIEPHNKLINLSYTDTTKGFIEHGIEKGDSVDLESAIGGVLYYSNQSEALGGGKVFKQKIDTSKNPIKIVSIT